MLTQPTWRTSSVSYPRMGFSRLPPTHQRLSKSCCVTMAMNSRRGIMTNTARASHRAQNAANESFAGTWTLLGFMLRRDRIWLPAWVLGLTALLAYFANALGLVLDEESLASFAALAANPLMALIGGPGMDSMRLQ